MGVNGIYGLSGSGLDIESMVKVGMMSKQNEYDKMAQKYTKNEWTKSALIDINSQITTFNLSSLSQYKMSSSMNAKNAESSSDAIKATANATAAVMTHKVEVTALSSNAYLTTGKNAISSIVTSNGGDASSIKLSDILFKGLSNEADVTSKYTGIATTKDGNGIVTGITLKDDENLADRVITSTTLNVDSSGNITGGTYTGTDGTTKDLTGGTANTTTLQTVTNTTFSKDGGTFWEKLTLTKTVDDPEGENTTSYELTGLGSSSIILTKNGSTGLYEGTYEDTDGKTVTVTFDGTDQIKTKKTQTYFWGQEYTAETSYSKTGEDVTVSTQTITTFDDGTTLTTTETRNGSGAITEVTSAEITTKETGIGGTTLADTGATEGVSVDAKFQNGKATSSVSLSNKAIEFTISDGTKNDDGTDKIATVKFTYDEILNGGKTINDLYSRINTEASNVGINVKASYDNVNGVFSLYNSKGGTENGIQITAVTNSSSNSTEGTVAKNFLDRLGLKSFDGDKLSGTALTFSLGTANGVTGTNGTIKVDGIEYETTDNKVTVGGVTYNALNVTETAATVSVTQDVDAIVDKVKSFVEDYNKLLASLYEKYDEKPDSGYKPLTQSQKDAMKEEQIEKWEKKAKEGLLYHDKTLSKIINDMRNAVSTSVSGLGDGNKYNSVYSIGISTTGIKGQLTLDETKLKKALSEDSDAVYNVFAKLDTTATASKNGVVKENGVAQRLGDIFTNATKLIKNRAGSSTDITEDSDLNNLLRNLQTKMSNFKKLMSAFEDRLYKKYDAMEATLAKLGMQMNFISGGQQ